LRCQIPLLTMPETGAYIRTRLRIAGARDLAIFSDAAVDRISTYTQGIPRLINTVCDHCLLFGYADQRRRIDRNIVNQAIEYLEKGTRALPRRSEAQRPRALQLLRWSVGTLVMTLASVVAALAFASSSGAMSLVQSVRRLLAP
jgi:hypothetical protein